MNLNHNTPLAVSIILACVSTLMSQDFRQTWFNPDEGWSLRQQKKGISIYARWVETKNGNKVRLVKSAMALDAPKKWVLPAIRRAEFAGQWVPRKKVYSHIGANTENSWLAYTQLTLPWPLKNMDFVVRYTMENEGKPVTSIKLQSASSAIPKKKGLKRMSQFTGAWTFIENGQDHTLIMYELCSSQPPAFPRWITDPIITRNMWRNMDMLRNFIRQNLKKLQAAAADSIPVKKRME